MLYFDTVLLTDVKLIIVHVMQYKFKPTETLTPVIQVLLLSHIT